MTAQNIFDNETFFDGYKELRDRDDNANVLFEIPAMMSMLPDLHDKTVLDLGCGYGEHCMSFLKMGAKHVVGIDISEKMLEAARNENSDPNIEYINMPIERIDELCERFDVVTSSLALHYVNSDDYKKVAKDVYRLLNDGGVFIFSQEHPPNTAYSGGNRWTKDETGRKLYLNLSNYGAEGERITEWFVEGVKVYHRMFSTTVNALAEAGFVIERVEEPLPTDKLLEKYPKYEGFYHMPYFLLIRGEKADKETHPSRTNFGGNVKKVILAIDNGGDI